MMDDIAEQLAIRDSFQRKMVLRESLDERVAAMWRLQENTWETLRSSPVGWDRFLRRNLKARAIEVKGDNAA